MPDPYQQILKRHHLSTAKVEESRQFIPYQGYHHHEHHWGPYFEEEKLNHVVVHVGGEALLRCRVSMLKDKTVSQPSCETLFLLTVPLSIDKHCFDTTLL